MQGDSREQPYGLCGVRERRGWPSRIGQFGCIRIRRLHQHQGWRRAALERCCDGISVGLFAWLARSSRCDARHGASPGMASDHGDRAERRDRQGSMTNTGRRLGMNPMDGRDASHGVRRRAWLFVRGLREGHDVEWIGGNSQPRAIDPPAESPAESPSPRGPSNAERRAASAERSPGDRPRSALSQALRPPLRPACRDRRPGSRVAPTWSQTPAHQDRRDGAGPAGASFLPRRHSSRHRPPAAAPPPEGSAEIGRAHV